MFRARFAAVVVAASLAASGCQTFDHPWFHSTSRDRCAPVPCDTCAGGGSMPIMDGPMLPPQQAMSGGACGLPPGALTGSPVQLPPGVVTVPAGQLPPGAIPVIPGQVPPNGQPRLVPTPQSVPMPYSPH